MIFLENPDNLLIHCLKNIEKDKIDPHILYLLFWGSKCYPEIREISLLLAYALSKIQENSISLKIREELLKKEPTNFQYLKAILNLIQHDREKLEFYSSIISYIYIETPPPEIIEFFLKNKIPLRSSFGIHAGELKGWLLLEKKETPEIEFWYTEPLPVELKKVTETSKYNVVKIKISLTQNIENLFIVRIKDKDGIDFPGSPIVVDPPKRTQKELSVCSLKNEVTVIIPVYDGLEETQQALESLFKSQNQNKTSFDILVIWDGGKNTELLKKLTDYYQNNKIQLMVLSHNRGFLSAVNEGLVQVKDKDVVILNSDTILVEDWLDRLKKVAYTQKNYGIVIPFTSKGELVSYPLPQTNYELTYQTTYLLDKTCKSLFSKKSHFKELPLGIGFCMYIKKEVLKKIGGFDGTWIYRGYGEDVDFTLRAKKAGLKTVLASNVFVGHAGEKSFSKNLKTYLAHQNNKAIEKRFSGYRENYLSFIRDNPLKPLREKISLQLVSEYKFPLVIMNSSDEQNPVFEAFKEVFLKENQFFTLMLKRSGLEINASLRLLSNSYPFEEIDFNFPEDARKFKNLLKKWSPSDTYLLAPYRFCINFIKDFNLNPNLYLIHYTPEFLRSLKEGVLPQFFKGIDKIYITKAETKKLLQKQGFKVETLKTIKTSKKKTNLNPNNVPEKSSYFLDSILDFGSYQKFSDLADKFEARKVNFFLANYEAWRSFNPPSNVFPILPELITSKDHQRIFNLKGIILSEKDPESEHWLNFYADRNDLELYEL